MNWCNVARAPSGRIALERIRLILRRFKIHSARLKVGANKIVEPGIVRESSRVISCAMI
jgi:hypothetical protein